MFNDFDYDNFPLIISSCDDFKYEINQIKSKIIPKVESIYGRCKHFSLSAWDVVKVTQRSLRHLPLMNLDAIVGRGSLSVCLLGEDLGDPATLLRRGRPSDQDDNNDNDSRDFVEKFIDSLKIAAESGYSWINEEIQTKEPSLLELLSMQAGLMTKIKFPLFYFRVSGGPLTEGDQTVDVIKDDFQNINPRMERLKEKLIRNGLPIRFYGSSAEFDEVVEKDLLNFISQFPDRSFLIDDFFVDQRCFEKEKSKYFLRNDSFDGIIKELDCFYTSLSHWTKSIHDYTDSEKINAALKDFCRKDFSDKLQNSLRKVSKKIIMETPKSCEDMKIFILSGPRGSGKSSIITNWISYQTDQSIITIIHYCEASSVASDLRNLLRRLINSIRSQCGYKIDLGSDKMYSMECEVAHLSQELLGAMLLSQKVGLRLLIVIDGLDHLGDKYSNTSQQIKDIHWIPEYIPDNIRLLLTCTTNDFSLVKLRSNREDVYVLETFQDDIVTADIISSGIEGLNFHIGNYCQTCPEIILSNIKDWSLIGNPMIQKILAHCYHTLGHVHNWTLFIECISECHSIVELIRRIMKLWIEILNWEVVTVNDKSLKKKHSQHMEEKEEDETFVKGWIPDCLSLLVLSRDGLNVNSLSFLLEKLGYVKDYFVSEFDIWSMFHFTQGIMMQFHNGNLVFSNSLCKEIVAHTFLAIATCSSVETRSQESQESMYVDKRCKLHLLLANHFWDKRNDIENNFEECIYHLNRASDYNTIQSLLFHPRVLLKLFNIEFNCFEKWLGNLESVHKFLYYWNLLSSHGFESITKIESILREYYGICMEKYNLSTTIDKTELQQEILSQPHSKNTSQSDFARRLQIKYENEDEKKIFMSFTANQSLRFLFLLGKIAVLLKENNHAKEILTHVINVSEDQVLVSKALFIKIELECLQHSTASSSLKSDLFNLVELTSKILEDETDVTRRDHISYLRGLVLLKRHSLELSLNGNNDIFLLLNEVKVYADDQKSIVLNSQMLEYESDSIEIRNESRCIERKVALLSEAITKLETWTGSTEAHLATLWVKLADCFKHGNYQSRLKAEACCRKAISIWKELCSENSDAYNAEESGCSEILISLLLQDICQTSVSEAKHHLYMIYDSRVKALGCYHPDTKRLVPLMKSVNSAESLRHPSERSKSYNHKESKDITQTSYLSSKNTSNVKQYKTYAYKDRALPNLNNSFLHDSRPTTMSSLQFINKYSAGTERFDEDINWDAFAEGKGSGNVSAFSKRSMSRSTKTDLLSCRLSCTSLHASSESGGNDFPKYIYSGHNSSLNISNSIRKLNRSGDSKQSKQVRFSAGFLNPYARQDFIDSMQPKLSKMQILKSHNWIPKKKSFSATFSRPYYILADPML